MQTSTIDQPEAIYVLRHQVHRRVISEGDCLVYTGRSIGGGYGQVNSHGRMLMAHRVAWIAAHGTPPEGYLRNTCGHRSCVNVDHWRDLGKAA